MNLRRLILRNVLRNKRRTGLTVLSIGFSLFLLIALFTFLEILFNPPATEESALRLAVRRSTSLADQMPLAYESKIARVPGVEAVMPLQWVGAVYKEPKNFFGNFAVDSRLWQMFPELEVNEQTKRAFAANRNAAVVGVGLMDRFGWKVGDRVTLKGTIFPVDLEFQIVGTYYYELDKNAFYFRFDYFNEALDTPNTIGAFWVKAANADVIPSIIDNIDGMFHNTSAETKTETEKAFVLGFIAMLGNIKFMVGSIAIVVVFTMLLVSASTMAMTIRERLREIAILKAIGYNSWLILFLILGEAVFLGFLGFITGYLLTHALGLIDIAAVTKGFVPYFKPPIQTYMTALAVGTGIGFLSGLLPAIQAARLTITQAMRQLE